jgi:transposase
MTSAPDLSTLNADELRQLASRLLEEVRGKQVLIDKLTHEMAILKRLKFAASSEAYTGEQQRMLFETLDTDIEALTAEMELLAPTEPANDPSQKRQPKRAPLPTSLPRKEVRHEPDSTTCRCGCQLQGIGEDVAEKLD